MAGYWLKLYTEIIDDPKYYRLSDQAKLGMYELMLVAKKTGNDGSLPSIEDICFYTRRDESWWVAVFEELKHINFVSTGDDGGDKIRKFGERQAAIKDNERQTRYREALHKAEFSCNENVTNMSRNVTEIKNKNRLREREEIETDANSVGNDFREIWDHSIGELQSSIPKQMFETYVSTLALIGVEDGVFKARAINQPTADLVLKRYGATLQKYLSGRYGNPVQLEVTV